MHTEAGVGRATSCGQASRSPLEPNVSDRPRTAGQCQGETTPQPGAPPVGWEARRWRWAVLESATNSSIGESPSS